jgi:hypothetical protein
MEGGVKFKFRFEAQKIMRGEKNKTKQNIFGSKTLQCTILEDRGKLTNKFSFFMKSNLYIKTKILNITKISS